MSQEKQNSITIKAVTHTAETSIEFASLLNEVYEKIHFYQAPSICIGKWEEDWKERVKATGIRAY